MTPNEKNRMRLATAAVERSGVSLSDADMASLIGSIADTLLQQHQDSFQAAMEIRDEMDRLTDTLDKMSQVRMLSTVRFDTTAEANRWFAKYYPSLGGIEWQYSDRQNWWEGRAGPIKLIVAIAPTNNHTSRDALK